MLPILIDSWDYESSSASSSKILPDGCRDLIHVDPVGREPFWFVTDVDATARIVSHDAGTRLRGFRLLPGVTVDNHKLMCAVAEMEPDPIAVEARIEEHCTVSDTLLSVLEALAASSELRTISRKTGLCNRTIQRLTKQKTGKPPSFWMQLSRVRRAARNLSSGAPLVEVAMDCGYADQAHMTRAFQRWFQVTPGRFASDSYLMDLVGQPGYF